MIIIIKKNCSVHCETLRNYKRMCAHVYKDVDIINEVKTIHRKKSYILYTIHILKKTPYISYTNVNR